jgi:hypothetical protein
MKPLEVPDPSGHSHVDTMPDTPYHHHGHSHEAPNSAAEGRARKFLIGGSIGSLVLGALEWKFGVSEELHGLIGNRNHNFGDSAIHAARAIAIGARLAGRNAKSKLFRAGSAYGMAAVTGVSAAHVGAGAWELWQHPAHVAALEMNILTKEAALSTASATLNAGVAVTLAKGTKGSSLHSEVASHSARDKFESAAFAATFVNGAAGVAAGAIGVALGAGLTSEMAAAAESEEVAQCSHAHAGRRQKANIRKKFRNLRDRAGIRLGTAKSLLLERSQPASPEARRIRRRRLIAAGIGAAVMGVTAYVEQASVGTPDVASLPDQTGSGLLFEGAFDSSPDFALPEPTTPVETAPHVGYGAW